MLFLSLLNVQRYIAMFLANPQYYHYISAKSAWTKHLTDNPINLILDEALSEPFCTDDDDDDRGPDDDDFYGA